VELCPLLEASGITVAYFDVICFDDYLQMLKTCTDITGRTDLWEQNGERLAAEITSVKQQYADAEIPISENRILLLRASSGFVKAKGSDGTVLGEMLADLGVVNIADTDGSLLENLSIEKIIAREPYRIFIVQVGDDAEAVKDNVERMMNENAAWKELSAVKEGRVYYLDKKLFNLKPNARWSEAYAELCSIFTK
jgi:iron complex transport system substrate-binding protein